jgi:hypothetical protein
MFSLIIIQNTCHLHKYGFFTMYTNKGNTGFREKNRDQGPGTRDKQEEIPASEGSTQFPVETTDCRISHMKMPDLRVASGDDIWTHEFQDWLACTYLLSFIPVEINDSPVC